MYNRFLYQRSSDFGRRWLSPRTSLCPYKDSSSAPFYPMSPRGGDISPPSSPSTNPHLFPTLRTRPLKHLHPYRHPLPINSPSQPSHTTLSTRFTEYISRTPTTHILRCPTESTLRVPAPQGLPQPTAYRKPYEALSMLGVVYTRVHKSVHTCTVMYTRVYNRAFIPISF